MLIANLPLNLVGGFPKEMFLKLCSLYRYGCCKMVWFVELLPVPCIAKFYKFRN